MRTGSCVSRQSQIIERTEIKGSDASSEPNPELRFANSATAKMINAEIMILRNGCIVS